MLTTFSRLRKLGKQSSGNQVVVFHNPAEVMDDIWEAIDSSQEEVLLMSYILKDDDVGKETLHRLSEAAKRGVNVQLVYDDAGNITGRSKLTAPLTEAGGDVVCFRPFWSCLLNYVKSGFDFRESPVLRNHRKIIIIDNKIGYIGGLNIGNEYAGRSCSGFYLTAGKTFKDCMVKLTGPCISDLRTTYEDVLTTPFCEETKKTRPDKPSWSQWMTSFRNELSYKGRVENDTQIISCNPWSRDYSIQLSVVETCRNAKKRIWITTPYYSPPSHIQNAIEDAARRGVDVRILVGGPNSTDPPIMKHIQRRWFPDALEAGCRFFEYNPSEKEVMHAKMWSVDGEYCSIGSYNMDLLSDRILESNVAFQSTKITSELEKQFLTDTSNSQELTKGMFSKRSQYGHVVSPLATGFYYFMKRCLEGRLDRMSNTQQSIDVSRWMLTCSADINLPTAQSFRSLQSSESVRCQSGDGFDELRERCPSRPRKERHQTKKRAPSIKKGKSSGTFFPSQCKRGRRKTPPCAMRRRVSRARHQSPIRNLSSTLTNIKPSILCLRKDRPSGASHGTTKTQSAPPAQRLVAATSPKLVMKR